MEGLRKSLQAKASLAYEKTLGAAKREIDTRILSLTSNSLEQVRKKIQESKVKWEQDKDFALSIASRVLDKAREVRESLSAEELAKSSLMATKKLKEKVLPKVSVKTAARKKTQKKASPRKKRVATQRA